MNPLVLQVINGNVFFIGLALAGLCLVMLLFGQHRPARVCAIAGCLLGAILVVVSSTPIPIWLYFVWCLGVVASMVLIGMQRTRRRIQIGVALATLFVSVGLAAFEAPYHVRPMVMLTPGEEVDVVGDSITAGIGGGIRTWPSILADLAHVAVHNHARAGARLNDAPRQVDQIKSARTVVVLEIGGNDLLDGVAPSAFEKQLDRLLSAVRRQTPHIVMLELPLPPFHNGIGRAQRILSRRYGVTLMPKSYLAAALGLHGGTTDGLHLSQSGQNLLAGEVARVFEVGSRP